MLNSKIQIELDLHTNKKLANFFPVDPNSDVTIVIDKKQYKLQKAHLRLESEYFNKLFAEDPLKNYYDLNIKSNPTIFEKILKSFYGTSFFVFSEDLYIT